MARSFGRVELHPRLLVLGGPGQHLREDLAPPVDALDVDGGGRRDRAARGHSSRRRRWRRRPSGVVPGRGKTPARPESRREHRQPVPRASDKSRLPRSHPLPGNAAPAAPSGCRLPRTQTRPPARRSNHSVASSSRPDFGPWKNWRPACARTRGGAGHLPGPGDGPTEGRKGRARARPPVPPASARRHARPASRAEEWPYAHSPAHARERADRLARTAKAVGRRSPAVSGGAAPPRARLGWWATRTGPGWGAGPAGGGPPPGQLWWRALPIPPAGPPPSELQRAIQHEPGPFGPGGSQCRSGKFGRGTRRPPGGLQTSPGKNVLFKGGLQPPPLGRRDHEAPRPQDGTGSTRSAGGLVRPPMSAGSRTRRTRAGAGGREARPAWRLATIHATKGGTGRPPGGCKRALERTFFSRAACSPPPGGPGLKAVLERTGSPTPCDEGEDLLTGEHLNPKAFAADFRSRDRRPHGGPVAGRRDVAGGDAQGDARAGAGGRQPDAPGKPEEPARQKGGRPARTGPRRRDARRVSGPPASSVPCRLPAAWIQESQSEEAGRAAPPGWATPAPWIAEPRCPRRHRKSWRNEHHGHAPVCMLRKFRSYAVVQLSYSRWTKNGLPRKRYLAYVPVHLAPYSVR